jgi:uncharacterized membrane protein YdjX (TVP38/TMEM64 family)
MPKRPIGGRLKPKLKLLRWFFLGAAFIVAVKYFNVQGLLRSALSWIAGLGPWGPIIFIIIYIFATVLFVPGSILALGAGVLFGAIWGSVYVSIGATIGAASAFLIGRYLARGWVTKQIEGSDMFKAIDKAVAREGWKIVGLMQLSPLFPFNLLNYAFGVTQVSFKDYFFPTWIGIMPGTVLYVYIGSLTGDLAMSSMGMKEHSRTPIEWTFYAISLIATVLVIIYVMHIVKKALANKITS